MVAQVCRKNYMLYYELLIPTCCCDFANQDQNTDSALIDRFSACSARPGSPGGMFANDM